MPQRARWEEMLAHEVAEWKAEPDVGTAADLLSYAIYPEAREKLKVVAEFLAREPSVSNSKALMQLVDMVRIGAGAHPALSVAAMPAQTAIRALRSRLREYPQNPIALVDLALAHVSLGNSRSAHRSLLHARTLAPNSRHALTALARYLVHADDAGAAQAVLERSPRTSNDPWLMSALVAVGQITGRTPRALRSARAMITAGSFSPEHISELAGSLATLELESGNRREARKLFNQALIVPTENVLAQLHWAHQSVNKAFEMKAAWDREPRAFELHALDSFATCDTNVAVKWALRWQEDEPFSSRPLILASFLLSILGRQDDAASLCRLGLITNPGDETLEQNLVYSLILSGNLEEASTRLLKMARASPSPMVMANIGCLLLAQGNLEGRTYYEAAIERLHKAGLSERAALAQGFYADALRRCGQLDWIKQLESANESNKVAASPAFAMLNAELQKSRDEQSTLAPPFLPTTRRMPQWHWDAKTNVVTIRHSKLL